jgi:hypothetical protein
MSSRRRLPDTQGEASSSRISLPQAVPDATIPDPEDRSYGVELSTFNRPKKAPSSRHAPPRIQTGHGRMSYQPLASQDPDDNKSYGSTVTSTEVTPETSPTALLQDEGLFAGPGKEVVNPFLDDETAAYWKNVYDSVGYECRHVFDPSLTWTAKEEQNLVRKLDWKVCLWAVCRRKFLDGHKADVVYRSASCSSACKSTEPTSRRL